MGNEDGLDQANTTSFGIGLNPMTSFNERVEMPLHHISAPGHRHHHLGISLVGQQSPLVEGQNSPAVFKGNNESMPLMSLHDSKSLELLQNEHVLQLRNLKSNALAKKREFAALQRRSVNQQCDELTSMRLQLQELKRRSGLSFARNSDVLHRNINELQSRLSQPMVVPYSSFQRDEVFDRNRLFQGKDGLLQELAAQKARRAHLEEQVLLEELASKRSRHRFENEEQVLLDKMYGRPSQNTGNDITCGSSATHSHSRIMNEAWNALMANRTNAVDNFH